MCFRLFWALVLVRGAAGWGKPELFLDSEEVVELQPEEFEDRVLKSSTKRAWVVDFYAHWCGHCKRFAPVWEQTAEVYGEDDRLRFGAVDCAKYSSFCGKLGVKSFPTLRAYNFPDLEDSETLKGADVPKRKSEEIIQFLEPHLSKLSAIAGATTLSPEDRKKRYAERHAKKTARKAKKSARADEDAALLAAKSKEADAAGYTAGLRLVDAEVALVYSLRQGAFLASTESSEPASGSSVEDAKPAAKHAPAISGKALSELIVWLDFLAVAFPSRRASRSLGALARVARLQQEEHGVLERDAWVKVLEGHVIDRVKPTAGEDPAPHWRLCKGYTCGLWTLFHLLLIAVAEAPSGTGFLEVKGAALAGPANASQALTRIRGFVAHFFGCADCVKHFLETFDSCKFGRCQLAPSDNRGAALWLWRVHNGVSKRVGQERSPDSPPASPQWPSTDDCKSCWLPDVSQSFEKKEMALAGSDLEAGERRFDASAMYSHLRLSFYRPEWTTSSGFSFSSLFGNDVAIQATALLLVSIALAFAVWMRLRGCCSRSKRGGTKSC